MEREDWAFDRNALKSEAEEQTRDVERASLSAADQNPSQGQSARPKEASSGRVRYRGGSPAAEAKGVGLTVPTRVEGNKVDGEIAMLRDLPTLDKKTYPSALADLKKQRVRVSLDLPNNMKSLSARLRHCRYSDSSLDGGRTAAPGAESGNGDGPARVHEDAREKNGIDEGVDCLIAPRGGRTGRGYADKENAHSIGDVPKEFLCAVNGHIMKQPARSPYGHVFEYSTILLWLEWRGSVCPFTGNTLSKEDLVLDDDLRTRVMRWHIQKTTNDTGSGALEGDDIYDF